MKSAEKHAVRIFTFFVMIELFLPYHSILFSQFLADQYSQIHSHQPVAVDWVRHYNSSSVYSQDVLADLVVDEKGNAYLIGYSTNESFNYDYKIVKFNSAGRQVWHAQYNGPDNDEDKPVGAVLDDAGNLYVTGRSRNAESSFDIVTIKYDSDGNRHWIQTFNGSADSLDEPVKIAIDSFGDVVVAGYTTGMETGADFLIIKYTPAGDLKMLKEYSSKGDGNDIPGAMIIDEDGNIYMAGASYDDQMNRAYAIIKFDNTGKLLWLAHPQCDYLMNRNIEDIQQDGAGNIYVGSPLFIMKYNPQGQELWDHILYGFYNGVIKVDQSGNIYFSYAFSEMLSTHIITQKYDSSGAFQWETPFDPGYGWLWVNGIDLDLAGNVYLTGEAGYTVSHDLILLKYSPQGKQLGLQTNDYSGGADYGLRISIESASVIYCGGGIENYGKDLALFKYDSSLTLNWISSYNSGVNNSEDVLADMVVDQRGNVYVTGSSRTATNEPDYLTIAYDNDGNKIWQHRYRSSAQNKDTPVAMAVDDRGNIYITGKSERPDTIIDVGGNIHKFYVSGILTLKYGKDGALIWTSLYNYRDQRHDIPRAIALDGSGNIYITGYSSGPNSYDYETLKYNTLGELQWAAHYNGFAEKRSEDMAKSIAVDDQGNVYVTGFSCRDYLTISYDTDGNERWQTRYKGPLSTEYPSNRAEMLALDGAGYVYVTGSSKDIETGYDFATIKYDAATGSQIWIKRFDGNNPYIKEDWAKALCIDDSGFVYMTGECSHSDFTTIKYDSGGAEQWQAKYDKQRDEPVSIIVDKNGFVSVTGYSSPDRKNGEMSTVQYDRNGVEQWAMNYSYDDFSDDRPVALATDMAGNVFLAGTSFKEYGSIFTTIKYSSQPTEIGNQESLSPPKDYQLFQNYPNPFNPVTTIKYTLPNPSRIFLKIFDVRGRLIKSMLGGIQTAGEHEVIWNGLNHKGQPSASGIYFYQLHCQGLSNKETRTFYRKMILLK